MKPNKDKQPHATSPPIVYQNKKWQVSQRSAIAPL